MKDFAPRQTLFSGGLLFLCLCCFFLPLSSSLTSISCAGLLLCWLFSGEVKRLPDTIKKNRITWLPVLLFVMLFIGVFYSSASWEESLMILKKYRELLYFPILLSFLQTERTERRNGNTAHKAKCALFSGMVVLMFLSYAMYFGWLTTERFGYSTIHHITHSLFMAILAFWALQKTFSTGNTGKKWLCILFFLLFLLAIGNLFFIAFGRSGMVIFVLLLALTLFQRLTLRQALFSLLLLAGLLAGLYHNAHNFSERVDAAVQDIRNYQPGASRSSLGMRFDWWQNSIALIKRSPITGYGTGSFTTEQQRLIAGTETQTSDNPHNEYLLLGVQLGLPGIAVFLALLTTLFLVSPSLSKENRNLLQGVVLAFAWGCLANSWLLDSHPSHFFLITAAILIDGRTGGNAPQKKGKNLLRCPLATEEYGGTGIGGGKKTEENPAETP